MKNEHTTHGELADLLQQVCKLYELKLRTTHADSSSKLEKLEERLEHVEKQVEQIQKGERAPVSDEKEWTPGR